jgi:serine beta-lactamase-like protein LACTB, mitochondrial
MHRTRVLGLVLLAWLGGAASAVQSAAPTVAAPRVEALVGTWDGLVEPPGITGGDPCALWIDGGDAQHLKGRVATVSGETPFEGSFDAARNVLALHMTLEDAETRGELALRGQDLVGHLRGGRVEWGLRLHRASAEILPRELAPRVVDLSGKERPQTWSMVDELDTDTALALDELLTKTVDQYGVVGVSLACVVDGKLIDVRSQGWEDALADVPASDLTHYRWASISKPLTSVAIARQVARGGFDLDADVRMLVPEFPDKGVTIHPRDILRHQSGITHYEGALRTWREYDSEYPFEQLVNGLDLFKESPLRFAPGAQYSYSTHAWTLLGLALERAGKKPYPELVRALVLEPAGMQSTEPDFRSHAIPHRSKGYERDASDRLVETLDDDVAWKLPGGGWTSTVGDLARFGAALIGSELLDAAQKEALWTKQKTSDGAETDMGLGFFLGELDGDRLVSHSGGQRKASTFLAILPERRLAVAAMSNTNTAPMEDLALEALRLLRPKR